MRGSGFDRPIAFEKISASKSPANADTRENLAHRCRVPLRRTVPALVEVEADTLSNAGVHQRVRVVVPVDQRLPQVEDHGTDLRSTSHARKMSASAVRSLPIARRMI